jgi:hypothetical protein
LIIDLEAAPPRGAAFLALRHRARRGRFPDFFEPDEEGAPGGVNLQISDAEH